MRKWSESTFFCSTAGVHGAHAILGGTIYCRIDLPADGAGYGGQNRGAGCRPNSFRAILKWSRDIASLIAGVMLHLR